MEMCKERTNEGMTIRGRGTADRDVERGKG